MNVTEEIKSRLDIVALVEEYLPLRRSGTSYTGFCPFHQNSRTPSFVVFPNTQSWRCFGACATGGDIFSFVMKKEGWDFKEALQKLASKAGVELEPQTPEQKAMQTEQEYITDLLTVATDYYHQLLLYAPEAEHVRQYLVERGLTAETIETFQLGFSRDSWDAGRTHFMAQGYSQEDLLDAGLLSTHTERGTTYDRFRGRLMIPIHNLSGQVVGFGARTLDGNEMPKYLNSPQTTAFNKSHLLYGLHLGKRHIRQARQVVIVEGYMDAIQAWQAGFRNVVAQMGTALTSEQLGLLKRYTKQFVIALDADNAGMKATLRSLEVARQNLERETDVQFDARGLVRQEGRLKADIRIVTLPVGSDPDDLIREDRSQWAKLVESAKPIVSYVIQVLTADLDLTDAKAKTQVAQQILPLIEDVADPIEREHYRQELARTLRTDERALHQVQVTQRRQQAKPYQNGQEAPAKPTNAGKRNGTQVSSLPVGQNVDLEKREANYIRQILENPHLYGQVNHALQENAQPVVTIEDFSNIQHRALFLEIEQHIQYGVLVTVEELCDSLVTPLATRLQAIVEETELAPELAPSRLTDRLALSVLDCRQENIRQQVGQVKQLLNQVQDNQELYQLYNQQIVQLPMTLLSINRAKGALSAIQKRRKEETIKL